MVIDDVLAHIVQIVFVANNVFIVIALPDMSTGRSAQFVNPFCDDRFELSYDGADRIGGWAMWSNVGATHWVAPTEIIIAGHAICR